MDSNRFPETVSANLVQLLREAREAAGMSMNAVAQRAGVSHSTISRIECDQRNPSVELVVRIAEAIGVSLPDLLAKAYEMAASSKSKRAK